MTHALIAGLAAGYGIAVPLGAVAVLIVSLAARNSFRIGAAAGLGAATADLIYAAVAVTTGYALAPILVRMTLPLQLFGAAVLAVLAAKGLRAAWRARADTGSDGSAAAGPLGRTYVGYLGLTLLNPLTIIYFAALVVGRAAPVATTATATTFVIGVFAASLSWQLLLAAVGATLHRSSIGASRFWISLIGNALIVAIAIRLAVAATTR